MQGTSATAIALRTAGDPSSQENYFERVAKYVPVEVVAAYLALQSAFASAHEEAPVSVQVFMYLIVVFLARECLMRIGEGRR